MNTFFLLRCIFQAASLGLKNFTCTCLLSAMIGILFSEYAQNPQGLLNRMFADRKSKTGMCVCGMNLISYRISGQYLLRGIINKIYLLKM